MLQSGLASVGKTTNMPYFKKIGTNQKLIKNICSPYYVNLLELKINKKRRIKNTPFKFCFILTKHHLLIMSISPCDEER